MTNELDNLTARLIDSTAAAMRDASDRRLASMPNFELPDRPADRSRNGRRFRKSASRARRTIL